MISGKPGKGSNFLDTIILNDIQRDAVRKVDGPQLVFAGAGSGKTRVLTAKIAYLIKECKYAPASIFAATFTNKAAQEITQRVGELCTVATSGLWVGTFHSLCVRILRRECSAIGFHSSFSIYDREDQLSVIKEVMKDLALLERTISPKMIIHKISSWKNEGLSIGDIEKKSSSFFDREIAACYTEYQKKLKKQQAMDFDDLICHVVNIFSLHRDILEKYQALFSYILVDEYQDTNRAQFSLVNLLAKNHRKIFVVGDDDQSIYSWRGANIDLILTFEKTFYPAHVHKLEQNYRSTPQILNFANAIIRNDTNRSNKNLWTAKKSVEPIIVSVYQDERHEAEGVAEKIKNIHKKGIHFSDIAVLFRTNAQSRIFEETFRHQSIPYILVGGLSFYERKEIKDCLAYLRLLVNPKDTIALLRIVNTPSRGIGAKTLEKLQEYSSKRKLTLFEFLVSDFYAQDIEKPSKGVSEFIQLYTVLRDLYSNNASVVTLLEQILSLTHYIDHLTVEKTEDSLSRIENINELNNALMQWSQMNPDKGLADYLEQVCLDTNLNQSAPQTGTVRIMTIHCSKGLEFNTVYIVGCEDGILPSKLNYDEDDKVEEECRLLYVAVTRAQSQLECSWVKRRMRFGSYIPMYRSRFLECIPDTLFTLTDNTALLFEPRRPSTQHSRSPADFKQPVKHSALTFSQKKYNESDPVDDCNQEIVQYRIGQIVEHSVYGKGRISSISGFGPDMKLSIVFNGGVRKMLMAKFANLQV